MKQNSIFENPFCIQRRSICVIRSHSVDGCIKQCAFQIAPRANWQEWAGAFSML